MMVVYLTTAIGIPVYMHYCGGELEKVSFLIQGDGCCDGEEPGDADGCCDNQNTFARYSPDFTVKKVVDSNFHITDLNLFVVAPSVFDMKVGSDPVLVSKYFFPPPDILHQEMIRTTFLRI
jgi:hypothetical protein